MPSNRGLLNGINARMVKLAMRHGENCLLVSQYHENPKERASVLIYIPNTEDDGDLGSRDYLAFRRLLQALAYKVSKETPFELKFELKRKKGR